MATYYVHGETGDDGNGDGSAIAPFASFANITPASGDVFNLAEKIRGDIDMTGTSGCVFQQSPTNATRWDIRGDRYMPQSGWTAATLAWSRAVPGAPSVIDLVTYKWDASIDAAGHHYGHLAPDTAVNVAAGLNAWTYNYTAGVLLVYLGAGAAAAGLNPNTAGFPVSYTPTPAATLRVGIYLAGGGGHAITGGYISLFSFGTTGDAIRIAGGSNNRINNVVARDCGNHGFTVTAGSTNSLSNIFTDCVVHGLYESGTHCVAQASTPFSCAGTRFNRFTAHTYRYLSPLGTVRAGLGTNAQWGFYCHGDAAGDTNVTDIECNYLDFTETELGLGPWGSTSTPSAPSGTNRWNWTSYPIRANCNGGTITCIKYLLLNSSGVGKAIAVTNFKLRFTGAVEEGAFGTPRIAHAFAGQSTEDASALIQNVDCVANLDDTTGGGSIAKLAGCDEDLGGFHRELYILNSSFYNPGTQSAAHSFMNFRFQDAKNVRSRGSIFVHNTGVGAFCCYQDAGTSIANHDIQDNAYQGVLGTAWSLNASIDATAEWIASVDAYTVIPVGTVFPNAPTDLRLTAASPLWTVRRQTGAIKPSHSGINGGAYGGFLGAYQYGGSGGTSGTGSSGASVYGRRRRARRR